VSAFCEQEVTCSKVFGFPDLAEFQDFAYHCQFAHLDDGLKDHLRSLACHPNITFTKSFPKSLVPDEQTCLLQSIFYFLQVIGRQVSIHMSMGSLQYHVSHKDFDPSGHCYWEYIKKETQCLRSAVPWGQRLVSMIPTWMFSEVVCSKFVSLLVSLYLGFGRLQLLKEIFARHSGFCLRISIPSI
jgi:hypothetical protein